MAEEPGGEKSLPASPQKKRKAREEGNVAKSQDLSAGMVLALALFGMYLFGPGALQAMVAAGRDFIGDADTLILDQISLQGLCLRVLYPLVVAVAPIALLLVAAGVMMNLLQVGVLFTAKPLQPKPERLNPITGLKRFVTLRSLVELVKSIAKLTLVTWLVYLALRNRIHEFPLLMELTPLGLVSASSQLVAAVWWRIALAMLVLGVLDYGFQYWQHGQDLRMTHREAREETKEMEGDPHVKRRIRQLQRQIAAQRMMAEVPEADVIITNPTHYAVALRYDLEHMQTPVVTAKGARLIAQRIRELAIGHDVPIVQKPELARTICRTVEVGDPIPEGLYHAVAEVLSFVYQIDRREAKIRERKALFREPKKGAA